MGWPKGPPRQRPMGPPIGPCCAISPIRATSCARCAGVSSSTISSAPLDDLLGFRVEPRDHLGAQFLDGGAVDGRRAQQIERLLAQRLCLLGIGREVGESRGDDVVRLGFLRRGSAHGIQQERGGALNESQAQPRSPAGVAGFLRRGCEVAHAEREAAGSEREPACQNSDDGEGAGPRASRLLQERWGGNGTSSIRVMAISFFPTAEPPGRRRRYRSEVSRDPAECKER